jgi:hypothetical protein
MGVEFTFYDFVDDDANQVWEWLHGDGRSSRATFNIWIAQMEAARPGSSLWARPYWDKMKGKEWADLYEIRKRGPIQFRLIACFGPGDRAVTLLAGGVHKDKQWTPHNLAALAQTRMAQVYADPQQRRREHDVS